MAGLGCMGWSGEDGRVGVVHEVATATGQLVLRIKKGTT